MGDELFQGKILGMINHFHFLDYNYLRNIMQEKCHVLSINKELCPNQIPLENEQNACLIHYMGTT